MNSSPGLALSQARPTWLEWLKSHWPLALGFAVVAIPSLVRVAEQVWTTEAGAHGPIVLATGIWLLTQVDWGTRERSETNFSRTVFYGAMVAALPIYVFGRAYDYISLEMGAVFLIMLGIAFHIVGSASLMRNFFPFLYLAFLIPPPLWLIDFLTLPLQHMISAVVTDGLRMLDYPIQRSGVSMYIAQYQLLVEQACSGMNSIVGLTAIILFHIYVLHRASWRYSLLLAALILPVAVFANLLRVLALVLITYYYGDAMAQGFLHVTTGIVLFGVALLTLFGIDYLLRRMLKIGDAA